MSVKIFFSRLYHSLRRENKKMRRDKKQLSNYELKVLEEELQTRAHLIDTSKTKKSA